MNYNDSEDNSKIIVRGAREHNLKNIDLVIPRNQFVVISGISGSGKSTLAFDTIYAEGQRRYVESLSAYARQFLDQLQKPDLDEITGLSPAIAIEQRTLGKNPRSTVGTVTEIYDFLRVLFARAGTASCPQCKKPISGQSASQMCDALFALPEGTRFSIFAPVIRDRKGTHKKELEAFRKQGFVRVRIDGTIFSLDEPIQISRNQNHHIDLLIDRLVVKGKARGRIAESLETALRYGEGFVRILFEKEENQEWFLSEHHACPECGISLPEVTPRFFSFNSPQGACPQCEGLGSRPRFDPERLVPDASRSIAEGAIEAWGKNQPKAYYQSLLEDLATHLEIKLDTPWSKLSKKARQIILHGLSQKVSFRIGPKRRRRQRILRKFDGVIGDLEKRAEIGDDLFERYATPHPCELCEGNRLRKEVNLFRVGNITITELASFSIPEMRKRLSQLQLDHLTKEIAAPLLAEINERLQFLEEVGLSYLCLNRSSASLSGGESQRIRLATQVGSRLMGVLYILDEPSIGLHPRDHARLLESLLRLRDMGNSLIVVEHDEETIRAADHLIDMGPGAGRNGGKVVAQGTPNELCEHPDSPTGAYLSGRRCVPIPKKRRNTPKNWLKIAGCREHNLKNIALEVPLGRFCVVSGVSGSGKSTLINETLYRALAARFHQAKNPPGDFDTLEGIEALDKVIQIDQSPIGRTPRSNPATYSGVFDGIRRLFAQVPEARMRGFSPGRFSFNVKGGRCEACSGDGLLRIEMHFLPDVFVTCEVCGGSRYNRETLDIRYRGCSIADVLQQSVDEASVTFENQPSLLRSLKTLQDVGLGYIHLGQSATTLSGGEAQRVKLSRELSRKHTGKTLYILDEPTTGLHFADVEKLLGVLHQLVDLGNTVLVIEHHLDVIKTADHVIDLGPEGGNLGGKIVASGTPEAIAKVSKSHTGNALRRVLAI